MKFRKKPVIIEAHQWFENGDHPEDESREIISDTTGLRFKSEGKIVRRFNHPGIPGNDYCQYCKKFFSEHGWIDTLEGGHNVCPGDWIITGVEGERYPCKPNIFEKTYEAIDENTNPANPN